MGDIELQLLCGVRIDLALGSLPYLAQLLSRSLPVPSGGTESTLMKKEGCYKHANPLGLRLNPVRGAYPLLDLGFGAQSKKQTNKQADIKLFYLFMSYSG